MIISKFVNNPPRYHVIITEIIRLATLSREQIRASDNDEIFNVL